MAKNANKGGKKGIGRSKRKPSSVRYSQSERWKRNKIKRIVKHCFNFPNYRPFNLPLGIADKVVIALREAA